MVLLGTIINAVCIIIGSAGGLLLSNIPEKYKETAMQGIGLVVVLIGLQMAFQTESIIIVLVSLLVGSLIGEFFQLENLLNQLGMKIGSRFTNKSDDVNISQAFVSASLIFIVGAMAIIGALDSGIRNDHEVLITKGIIDGFTSFVLASTLGIGVMLAAVPLFIYQGLIALLATQIVKFIPEPLFDLFLVEITALGGLLILAIGLNILKLTKIRVTNLLPALLIVCLAVYLTQLM